MNRMSVCTVDIDVDVGSSAIQRDIISVIYNRDVIRYVCDVINVHNDMNISYDGIRTGVLCVCVVMSECTEGISNDMI